MAFEYSKQGYMKAWSYGGVDLFAADGSGHIGTYCLDHFAELHPDIDIESEEVSPIFASDEMDFYPACEVHGCEVVFDYVNLTDDGREWEAMHAESDSDNG